VGYRVAYDAGARRAPGPENARIEGRDIVWDRLLLARAPDQPLVCWQRLLSPTQAPHDEASFTRAVCEKQRRADGQP
jgi:hypothetical protein